MTDEELRLLWMEYCRCRVGQFTKSKKWLAAMDNWERATRGMRVGSRYLSGGGSDPTSVFIYELSNGKTYRTDQPL